MSVRFWLGGHERQKTCPTAGFLLSCERSHIALRWRAEVDKHLAKSYEVTILLSDLDQETLGNYL